MSLRLFGVLFRGGGAPSANEEEQDRTAVLCLFVWQSVPAPGGRLKASPGRAGAELKRGDEGKCVL